MNIDFHTHCKLSKKAELDMNLFKEMIQEAKSNGVEAITCTEHFNTKNFHHIYDTFDEMFTYQNDYYEVDGFRIFPGMEIDVKEVGHILFISNRDSIRNIREKLEGHTNEDNFIPFEELLQIASDYEVLKIGGHPFRESTPLHHHKPELLQQLDAFDLNAKDLYRYGNEMRPKVEEFAKEIGIPVVAGSDSHHPLQYGSVINRFNETCETIYDLKNNIQSGTYQIEINPCLPTKVKAAKSVKKVLKELLSV